MAGGRFRSGLVWIGIGVGVRQRWMDVVVVVVLVMSRWGHFEEEVVFELGV